MSVLSCNYYVAFKKAVIFHFYVNKQLWLNQLLQLSAKQL